MSNVLIVGNITKDVYLRLDNRRNTFEVDDSGTAWLDLAFNGESHNFFRRFAVYGGAVVAFEVLRKFGIDTKISHENISFSDGNVSVPSGTSADYRYILSRDDDISYFSPSERSSTKFVSSSADWIYLDRSANLSRELCDSIANYLSLSPSTKLAIFISPHSDTAKDYVDNLVQKASFIFTDDPNFFAKNSTSNLCYIEKQCIHLADLKISWSLGEKDNLLTTLTSHTIIASSILASNLLGFSPTDQLLLAKYNVESATLDGTTNLSKLKDRIMNQDWQVKTNSKDATDTTPDDATKTQVSETPSSLHETATLLVTHGKGILAADESGGSIHKKFESMGIIDDEQHRRDYRNIFFTTPDLEKYASGVILFDETARQKADDGNNFVAFLKNRGLIPGIKVDQGLENFSDIVEGFIKSPTDPNYDNLPYPTEKWTKGLIGLPKRLTEYYEMGCRFAKWRAAFEVDTLTPTQSAIDTNCDILARYAKDCQSANIVPIVEPEIVFDGNYSIVRCAEATTNVLKTLFDKLHAHKVDLSACILKCNMVLAGKRYPVQSTPEEVGKTTAAVLRSAVPDNLSGVVFLSGGQSVEQATDNLQAITNNGPFPWPVTFSFARALQDPALTAWRGDNANIPVAREAFRARLIANSNALTKSD